VVAAAAHGEIHTIAGLERRGEVKRRTAARAKSVHNAVDDDSVDEDMHVGCRAVRIHAGERARNLILTVGWSSEANQAELAVRAGMKRKLARTKNDRARG